MNFSTTLLLSINLMSIIFFSCSAMILRIMIKDSKLIMEARMKMIENQFDLLRSDIASIRDDLRKYKREMDHHTLSGAFAK